jgi:hypothetical protein
VSLLSWQLDVWALWGRTGPDVNFTFLGTFYVLYKKTIVEPWALGLRPKLLSQPVVSHADRRASDVCKLYGMCDALQVLTFLLVVSYCNDTQFVTPKSISTPTETHK